MKLRASISDQDIDKGFDQNDLSNRKDLAQRLTTLLCNLEDGAVCLLDGKWGEGKTTFVRQWAGELKKKGIASIYFDAFASDYMDSPFNAIAGSFVKKAKEVDKSKDPQFREFLDRAAVVGKAIAATTAKASVKALTLGVVGKSEIDGLTDAIADGLGEVTESGVRALIEEYSNHESQFSALRQSLSDLSATIAGQDENGDDLPLIIFIDELDRCRPNFSLGVLEVLKHFFRGKRIHFVLVTSKNYLTQSVNKTYGMGNDSEEYLEKFYDFIITFQNTYKKHQGEVSKFSRLNMQRLLGENYPNSFNIVDNVEELSIAYKLSLRQIENLCITSAIALLAVRDMKIYKPEFLVILLCLVKIMDLNLFRKLKDGSAIWQEMNNFILKGEWNDVDSAHVSKVFRWHLDRSIKENDPEYERFGQGMWNYNLGRHDTIKYLADAVVDRFSAP